MCTYIALLLFTIHLSACGLRLITGMAMENRQADNCYKEEDSPNVDGVDGFGPDEDCP